MLVLHKLTLVGISTIKDALAWACLSCQVAIVRTSKIGIMCPMTYATVVCYECRWLIEWITLYAIPKAVNILQNITMGTCFLLCVWWPTWFSFVPLTYFAYVHCVQKHCTIIGKILGLLPTILKKQLDFTNVNQVLDGLSQQFFLPEHLMLSRAFNASWSRFVLFSNVQIGMWPTCSFLNVTWVDLLSFTPPCF